MYELSRFLNARFAGTDATSSGIWFQHLAALHAKLFLLLLLLVLHVRFKVVEMMSLLIWRTRIVKLLPCLCG